MSNRIKCYDVVSEVAAEATKQFKPLWNVNREKELILKQYCGYIDELIEKFDGVSIDVNVDNIRMTIAITIECPDIVFENNDEEYYELISRAVSIRFYVDTADLISVQFVFPSIWEKT